MMLDGRGDQQLTNADPKSPVQDVHRKYQMAGVSKDLRKRNNEKSKDLLPAVQKVTSNLEEKTSPSPKDPLTNEVNPDVKNSDFEKVNQHQESNNDAEAMDSINSDRIR